MHLIILPIIQSHEKAEKRFVSNMADSEKSELSPMAAFAGKEKGLDQGLGVKMDFGFND